MKNIFRYFAKQHMFANMIVVMVILGGILSLGNLQRDTYPKVEFGEVIINTIYPGASPEDVEINVTNKIEDEVRGVAGIDKLNSISVENASIITIKIDLDEDIDTVVQDIRDAVDRVTQLPSEVEDRPLVTEITAAEIPIIEVGFAANNSIGYKELRDIARNFEKKLKEIDGVATLLPYGLYDREVRIEVDPEKLRSYQVSMSEVITAIQQRNVRQTAGKIESYTNEKTVVVLAEFDATTDVGDVIVRSTFNGPVIRVSDLATIRDGFETPALRSNMNGQSAISFIVKKSESADILDTVDDIKTLVSQTEAYLPAGVDILFSNDMSRYVRNRLQVVSTNALIGLALVLGLLTLFFNIKTAFWVAMGIPVAVFGSFIMLPVFGSHIEVVSLMAFIIVIGIIVDDAIIVSENIARHREEGAEPLDAAVNGLSEVWQPVLTTILTTFLAFAPMFFMSGVMGKFVFVIPLVISLALLFSLLEIFIALPAHLLPGLAKIKPKQDREVDHDTPVRHWFDPYKALFSKMLRWALMHRWKVFGSFLVVFVAMMMNLGRLVDFVLFPSESADTFAVHIELPTGTSLDATADKIKEVEAIVAELPEDELQSFVSRIGARESAGDFNRSENSHLASILVNLEPASIRKRTAETIVNELREKAKPLTGYTSLNFSVDAGGPPVGKPVEVRVVVADDALRKTVSNAVVDFLEAEAGVTSIERNDTADQPQYEVVLDYETVHRLGISVRDVAQQLRLALDGDDVSTTRYGDEDVDFRVIYDLDNRQDVSRLDTIWVPNKRGQLVSLSSVATVVERAGQSAIYHYDGERSTTITAEVVSDVTTPLKVTNALTAEFDVSARWPGVRLVFGGEGEETQESMVDLGKAFVLAGLGIFFLLVLLFNSFAQPLLVLMAVPCGLIGVVLTFFFHGLPLGFLAMMGVIGMSGVVVNDSLVLVSYMNELRQKYPERELIEVVVEATVTRLRPIVMTTLTTVVGLLPLAYGIGGSDPFIAPMALALGYGLVFAMPLTIYLLPCLYMMGNDFCRVWKRYFLFSTRK